MRSHDIKCLKLFDNEGMTYHQIADELDLTYDEVKHALKRARRTVGKDILAKEKPFNVEDAVIKLLKKGTSKEEICDTFAINESKANDILDNLMANGICIDDFEGFLKLGKTPVPDDRVHAHVSKTWKGDLTKFGIVSDTHLCSKYVTMGALHKFYDVLENEEIDTVYHAGDMLDGHDVYPGHLYELAVIGSDAQVNDVIENYPCREGITTRFITGNHDLSFFKKGGRDVGKSIVNERSDLDYLGQLGAYVTIGDKSMYLVHPDGGSPYQISYRAQILARGFTEESKPDIMVVGHLHQLGYFIDRGIHILLGGSFQAQTPYCKRKGLLPQIGGWIIEVGVYNEKITSFNPVFVPFSEL